ncbi:SET domain-containing protein, partial [Peniophora sp. CONT]
MLRTTVDRGCSCKSDCQPSRCQCSIRQETCFREENNDPRFVYDNSGRLCEDVQDNLPVYECNVFCSCPASCPNRVTQHGWQYGIQLKHTGSKGYGVFTREKIPAHTYVGTFAGELI